MMPTESRDSDRSHQEHLSGAFCLSSLAFAFMSCLSLGDDISPWKVEIIFNPRKRLPVSFCFVSHELVSHSSFHPPPPPAP